MRCAAGFEHFGSWLCGTQGDHIRDCRVHKRQSHRLRLMGALAVFVVVAAVVPTQSAAAGNPDGGAVLLTADDFRYGTYIIDRPGTYRLTENISFNPNSPRTLNAFIDGDPSRAASLGLMAPPVDAYQAGFPLYPQLITDGVDDFQPGGPLDPRYDPAAYGVGFFAAISVTADNVVLDLNGHTIEQSAEHALLQRFFAVIELADQPFLPSQGPSDFGGGLDSANEVSIRNGTIGRSAHHGVHGNGNVDVKISNVDFVDYEVAAVALNGVRGLDVRNVTATNRKDVPVLGTFSSAQFIKLYVDDLARRGSLTTIEVGGELLGVNEIRTALREAINTTHNDIILDGIGQIRQSSEPAYGLFHNQHGVVDGNSYSFLVNSLGVAVNGFPYSPLEPDVGADDVRFSNVHVSDQVGFINEVPALNVSGSAVIDPVGAVFQTQNRHPDSGDLLTIATDRSFVGNPVANAQAFVAKAELNGEFANSHLDVTRLNISGTILDWVEGDTTFAEAGLGYLCNGDSMFHVNKGVIGFRMDSATNVSLTNTSVSDLTNLGRAGSGMCGDYGSGVSHPAATLDGYGGSATRAYTFAGSDGVVVRSATAQRLSAHAGAVVGFDVLTDGSNITFRSSSVRGARASESSSGPTPPASVYGFHIGPEGGHVTIISSCASGLIGADGQGLIDDETGNALLLGRPRRC